MRMRESPDKSSDKALLRGKQSAVPGILTDAEYGKRSMGKRRADQRKKQNSCRSRYRLLSGGLLAAVMLTACGSSMSLTEEAGAQEKELTTLGLVPSFDYEVPVSKPSILVDQLGYDVNSSKIAIFEGEDLPGVFELVDADTGEIVYTAKTKEKGYDETTGSYISYGDFSEFEKPGEYCILSEVVGWSYPFEIKENPYQELFEDACRQYYLNRCGVVLSSEYAGSSAHNACHTREAQLREDASVKLEVSGGWHTDENGCRDVGRACEAVNMLLLAYELYPDMFTDDAGIPESGNGIPDLLDEIRYEADWLLKMQNAASGAVYASVSAVDAAAGNTLICVESASMDATIRFAAAMAKFSYLYQSYDWDYANTCLKAADRAYRCAQQYPSEVSAEDFFAAAAELYRATGAYGYHTAIEEYLGESPELDLKNDSVLWGAAAYLSTKQKVDVKQCDILITALLREAEQVSYASKNSKFLVNMDKNETDCNGMLSDIVRLAVVDHVITNHEYTTVLENQLHYFLGRNPDSVSYLDGAGDKSYREIDEKLGIMNQVDLNAKLILMMSAILSS